MLHGPCCMTLRECLFITQSPSVRWCHLSLCIGNFRKSSQSPHFASWSCCNVMAYFLLGSHCLAMCIDSIQNNNNTAQAKDTSYNKHVLHHMADDTHEWRNGTWREHPWLLASGMEMICGGGWIIQLTMSILPNHTVPCFKKDVMTTCFLKYIGHPIHPAVPPLYFLENTHPLIPGCMPYMRICSLFWQTKIRDGTALNFWCTKSLWMTMESS
jgi:hypothetical protein